MRALVLAASDTSTVAVTSRASKVTSSFPTVAQNSTTSLTVKVLDGANSPLFDQPVTFVQPSGVSISPLTARTTQDGTVTVQVSASSAAAAGVRPVQFSISRAGTTPLVVSADITVLPAPSKVTVQNQTLSAQPGSVAYTSVLVTDANDVPVKGAWVSTESACATGVRVTGGTSTGEDGTTMIAFHVDSASVSGTYRCSIIVAATISATVDVSVP